MAKKAKTHKITHPDHIKGIKRITHSPHRDSPRINKLLLISAACVVVSVFGLFGVYIFSAQTEQNDKELQRQNIKDAILQLSSSDLSQFPELNNVVSSLGFTLSYDKNTYEVSAQVTDPQSTDNYVYGIEYNEEELGESRPYSIVKLRQDSSEDYFGDTQMSVVTNIRKSFWQDKVNAGESQIDALARYANRNYTAESGWAVGSPEDITINDIPYKKIARTRTTKFDSLEVVNKDIVYVAVQNERPYIITITNAEDRNIDKIKQFESVIKIISYGELDDTQLALADLPKRVLGDSTEALTDKDAYIPYDIDEDSVFDVILRNQPAVVRVATISCADIELKSSVSGPTTLKDACSAGTGSGSIVSEDGYIATNGHVVSVTKSNLLMSYLGLSKTQDEFINKLKQILGNLEANGVLSATTGQVVIDNYRNGQLNEGEIIAAINKSIPDTNMNLSNDTTNYYVQLGQKAMRPDLTKSRISLETSESIVSAKYIDQDFDPQVLAEGGWKFGESTASDVALLKIDGKYPIVVLGNTNKLDKGDKLTAIGYPAFVDGGLRPNKNKTKPTITQGEVLEIATESEDNVLIATSIPISGGNSGGPTIDKNGKQIGLNTYGAIECADGNCFGEGIARDISDFKQLVSKNDINLDTSSKVSELWNEGLDRYLVGNYKGAVKTMATITDKYPSHYLADSMSKLAKSKFGTASDKSADYDQMSKIFIVIVVFAIISAIVFIVLIAKFMRGSHVHNKSLYANQSVSINQPGSTNAQFIQTPQSYTAPNQTQVSTNNSVISQQGNVQPMVYGSAAPANTPQMTNQQIVTAPPQQLSPQYAPQPVLNNAPINIQQTYNNQLQPNTPNSNGVPLQQTANNQQQQDVTVVIPHATTAEDSVESRTG